MTFDTVLARSDGTDLSVTVEFYYSGGSRGARDSLGGVRGAGPPLEPDEDETVEIENVCDSDGNAVELSNAEEQHLEACAWEQVRQEARKL